MQKYSIDPAYLQHRVRPIDNAIMVCLRVLAEHGMPDDLCRSIMHLWRHDVSWWVSSPLHVIGGQSPPDYGTQNTLQEVWDNLRGGRIDRVIFDPVFEERFCHKSWECMYQDDDVERVLDGFPVHKIVLDYSSVFDPRKTLRKYACLWTLE